MSEPQLSESIWPMHLKPKDDELLSSWLVRLAIAHGMKLHTFCSLAWPGKQIWNRDIDKCADTEMLEMLSAKTGTHIKRVQATTLAAYTNILYEKHNRFGPSSWIMPIGVYHRTHKQFGLQYCPRCLAEDKEPYYRCKWRLAFVVVCEKHYVVLHDRCPKCGAAVNFHRNELGHHRKVVSVSLTLCHACHFDLRKIADERIAKATAAEAEFATMVLQTIDTGFIQLSADVTTYSHLFFAGLRQLMKILAMRDKRIVKLRQAVGEAYGIEIYTPSALRLIDVQELGIEGRRQLLGLAVCLLQEWPHRFVKFSRKFKVWSSLWLRHVDSPVKGRATLAPFWFWSVVHEQLYRARYSPSREEMGAAIRHLNRKGMVVNKSTLARLLGVAVVRGKTSIFN